MNVKKWLSKLAIIPFVFALIPLSSYGQPRDWRGRFEEYLNLTPEQRAKFDEFRKARIEERQAQFEKMQKLRTDLREAMKDPETNEAKLNGLIDEMSKFRAERMKRGLAMTREMRKILTPEQREKLAKMRDRMEFRREVRSFRGRRNWDRGRVSDFGRRRPPMDRRSWRW
jgi:Spy/CpxP family protein refolding chaperone